MSNQVSNEYILRSLQKDNEYINHLNIKFLKFIETLTHLFSLNFNSQNIESISKFLFYFCNYILRIKKVTPGEEYTSLHQQLSNNKMSVTLYVILLSFKNLTLKFIHTKFNNFIQSKIKEEEQNSSEDKYSTRKVLTRTLIKMSEQFINFENILEKIEDYQYCILFIYGNKFDFIQRLFKFDYFSTKSVYKQEEIITTDGFRLLGYLMASKLVLEIYQNIKLGISIYKAEKNKLLKEIDKNSYENDLNNEKNIKINLKKQNNNKSTIEEQNLQCLLCLDDRKNSSITLCGHLFCWACIIKYLQTNTQCPFCRQECHPQNIILLQNY